MIVAAVLIAIIVVTVLTQYQVNNPTIVAIEKKVFCIGFNEKRAIFNEKFLEVLECENKCEKEGLYPKYYLGGHIKSSWFNMIVCEKKGD